MSTYEEIVREYSVAQARALRLRAAVHPQRRSVSGAGVSETREQVFEELLARWRSSGSELIRELSPSDQREVEDATDRVVKEWRRRYAAAKSDES